MPPPKLLQQVSADVRQQAMEIARDRLRARQQYREAIANKPVLPIVEWAERRFYIEETRKPVVLALHQKAILQHVLTKNDRGRLPYVTVVYSTIKKSAKTATAGMVARYFAETQAAFGEVFTMANDFEQAKGRIFQSAIQSIELDPNYDPTRRTLGNEWLIREREARHLPSSSVIKASAAEYKSAAGSNPSITLWSELWAFQLEASRRLWDEMTPVPTRPNSLRWVETYAGFEGESDLLNNLMDNALLPENGGRQMTAGELGQVDGAWPFAETTGPDDLIPCYVNREARLFVYYDTGIQARRMPWQMGEDGEAYYAEEERSLRPNAFRRLHMNERVSAESSFVPIEWWDACGKEPYVIPERAPTVVAIDAGINSDTFGLIAVTRHPTRPDDVAVRAVRCFVPPPGGEVDFGEVEATLREWDRQWIVEEYAYDAWQMHDMRRRLSQELNGGWRKFSQGSDRLIADKQLYDRIRGRRIAHSNDPELRRHILNANAKMSKEEDNKLRIVKRAESLKIDLAVCLSMAVNRCLQLGI